MVRNRIYQIHLFLILFCVFLYSETFTPIPDKSDTSHFTLSSKDNTFKLTLPVEGAFCGRTGMWNYDNSNSKLFARTLFYSKIAPAISYKSNLILKPCVYVVNYQIDDAEDCKFIVQPEVVAAIQSNYNNQQLGFKGGYIQDITLGCGLTMKDFSSSGAYLNYLNDFLEVTSGYFPQGYGYCDGLIWNSVALSKIHAGINFLTIINNDYNGESSHYNNYYILPQVTRNFWKIKLYGECGLKILDQKNTSTFIPQQDKYCYAGLAGLKYSDIVWRFHISCNMEYRYYLQQFIPSDKIKEIELFPWQEDQSANNWIDFFVSNRKSKWYYLSFDIAFALTEKMRIYCHDELLYFKSSQTYAFNGDYGNGYIYSFNPSVNYFNAGLRYEFVDKAQFVLSVRNKLRNNDAPGVFTKRFATSNNIYFDARVEWKF